MSEPIVQPAIEAKLAKAFEPEFLAVENESFKHNVPAGSESHFKVVIVSDEFAGKRLIARHRAVNSALAHELAEQIHALSIHTYTPEEWQEQGVAPSTPMCLGGDKQGR